MYSDGITIDTTRPEVVGNVDSGPMYLAELDQFGAQWRDVFREDESGKYIQWYTLIVELILFQFK